MFINIYIYTYIYILIARDQPKVVLPNIFQNVGVVLFRLLINKNSTLYMSLFLS